MELFAGAHVAGRYLAEHKAGEGSFGEVWAGKHLALGIKVALKTLLPAAAADDETVARFRREARLLARIQSDYVVRVLDFVQDASYGLVLVMDFLEGDLLFDVLRGRCMSVEEAVDVGVDVLRGLADLHAAHVIHRDLKPGNILLRRMPGGGRRAIIFDFSLSREDATRGDESSLTDLTKSNVVMGTVPYMAPEQALNARQVTERSDVYAVGAILYRMVTGRQLFGETAEAMLRTKLTTEAPPVQTGRTDALARAFEGVVGRAIQRRPGRRFASARAMLDELRALQRSPSSILDEDEVATSVHDTQVVHDRALAAAAPVAPRAATEGVSGPSGETSEDQRTIRLAGAAPRWASPAGGAGEGGVLADDAAARPRRGGHLVLSLVGAAALLVVGGVAGSFWTERRLGGPRVLQADGLAETTAPNTSSGATVATPTPSTRVEAAVLDASTTRDGAPADAALDGAPAASPAAGEVVGTLTKTTKERGAAPRPTPRAPRAPSSAAEPAEVPVIAVSDLPLAKTVAAPRPTTPRAGPVRIPAPEPTESAPEIPSAAPP